MASPKWTPRYVGRPAEHGRDCAYAMNRDICDCYLSWDREVLAATSVFTPASAGGAAGEYCQFDEYDEAALARFVCQKKNQVRLITTQRTSSRELYGPLGEGETRVLEIHSGRPGASLQGSLHIVSVDFTHAPRGRNNQLIPRNANESTYRRHTNHAVSLATGRPVWYTALSYVWGIPVFDQSIQFAHESIKITSSLASALFHLRSTVNSIYLWVDQVSINQSDIREKEQQIPLMGLIYTNATNTLIWLGDENGEEPSAAFETMEYVYARLQMGDIEVKPEDFERLDFPLVGHRSWVTIRHLLRRPWFSRLWTIQEAILSRSLHVQCGTAVVCWDDMAAWTVYLEQSGLLRWPIAEKDSQSDFSRVSTPRQPLSSGGEIINSIQSERIHHLTLEHKTSLLNMLVSTRYAQATKPKDKIYGILGVADSQLAPDYSPTKTSREVYHEACLSQVPTLIYKLLSCIDHDKPLEPSWVPDWSAARVTEALGYSTKAWTLYCAGGKPVIGQPVLEENTSSFMLSEDKKQVTLSGVVVDKVVALGCVSERPTLHAEYCQERNRDWASYVELVRSIRGDQEYPSPNTSVYDAFWQTLVAGRDGSGIAAPTQEHSDVFSVILDATTLEMPSLPGQIYSPRRLKGFFTLNSLRTRKPAKTLEDFNIAMRSALTMRRFAITQKGYFALVPRGAREGDEIAVFKKACVPFVVRKAKTSIGESGGYQLLGEAYVHGVMKGEVLDMPDTIFEDMTLV